MIPTAVSWRGLIGGRSMRLRDCAALVVIVGSIAILVAASLGRTAGEFVIFVGLFWYEAMEVLWEDVPR